MSSMSQYAKFIHKSRYARWVEDKNRRENWDETVGRYLGFFSPRIPENDRVSTVAELEQAILSMDVMPSMRALMTAGKALEKDNVAGYNCSYIAVDDPRAFDEAMYISMCGTGVGFSVEHQYVKQLPAVAENFYKSDITIEVRDSKIGWATGFKELISLLYAGMIPQWNLSKIRPAGSILKTFGGRASGPGPLNELFKFTSRLFQNAAGRKLTTIECHDLMCKVADVVVSGGVRRSAMISLSDLNDELMRQAKNGQWWTNQSQRRLANNSAIYTEKPPIGNFMHEWVTLHESKSGERGIFNRYAATLSAKRTGRRKWEGIDFGCNPCAEILLRAMGLCNLTEVVIRPEDTWADIKRKIRIATILGTLQATLTNFRYLRAGWKKNAEEEALLGVSLTGIMDNPLTSTNGEELAVALDELHLYAVEVNKEWAAKLKINQAAAVTCVKPSGTVSQLVGSSSGIHTRYAHFIDRAVRNATTDPISKFLKAAGVPWEPDVMSPTTTEVFHFPVLAPATSVCRNDRDAIEQLELYLTYKKHWCEHNPSCTVYVREKEWLRVASWVYDHFEDLCGVSFLPYDDHVYEQPPYAEITEDEYHKAVAAFPEINWNDLMQFESDDRTANARELACSAGHCELPDFHPANLNVVQNMKYEQSLAEANVG